ncbi:MAG: Uma2 family endonuclease [Phaeodactylibacter sp.]|nr:Uma2 family endonuclease [Phaeodactylibacter sp.]MCB9298604.1 Uma2 family endonuclease [Lewinellaceae bacterium]
MASTASATGLSPIQEIVELGGEVIVKGLSKQQFCKLAEHYPELLMEREKNGTIYIMTPVKGGSGFRESKLSYYLTDWAVKEGRGMVFSPSTGFDLPDGATKSPDVAWVSSEKMAQLRPEQVEEEFIPAVPDFVAELRSKSDRLKKLQKKMKETWIKNGVRLAWLIDPYEEKAYIYRADGSREAVAGFDRQLSGEEVLPGFVLALSEFRLLGKV